ncbi:hypothetical protein CEXT_723951 [Caerostris extrusa]|uniref:Uncharacterized protein n=1 Tax=Caerostris extrusa TaxID=172846 RepID=A0AAV4TVB7_CAEEX|nr:hypothetical protein CEXT_723951 [Caerostris extrusa]
MNNSTWSLYDALIKADMNYEKKEPVQDPRKAIIKIKMGHILDQDLLQDNGKMKRERDQDLLNQKKRKEHTQNQVLLILR